MVLQRLAVTSACALGVTLAGCAQRSHEDLAVVQSQLVAVCEREQVVPDDDAHYPEVGFGELVDVANEHVLVQGTGSTLVNSDLTNHFRGIRSYRRSAGGTWAPDSLHDGFLVTTTDENYPELENIVFAVDGDRAVLAYHRILGPAVNPPWLGYPYQTVVALFRAMPAGYVAEDEVVIESGLSRMFGTVIMRVPDLDIAIDGDDVVVGRTWFSFGNTSWPVVDDPGIATTFQISNSGGGLALVNQQSLSMSLASWRYGSQVAVRGGLVAVTDPGPAGDATIYLFQRDATGTFQPSAAAFPQLDALRPLHVAIVDPDHVVVGTGAAAGDGPAKDPVMLYERQGQISFQPTAALPLGPDNTSPTVESIDAAGIRVAVGGENREAGTAWIEVYRWDAGAGTFIHEFSRAPSDPDALGSNLALDAERLVVARKMYSFSIVEAWPIEELEAFNDTYVAKQGHTLVAGDVPAPPSGPDIVVYPDGVMANDALHCAKADAVLDLPPAHGTVALEPGGGFVYKPLGNQSILACGDRFEYHLAGGTSVSQPARVDIDFDNPNCTKVVWVASEQRPYIYKGCPDPGPEPWRDIPVITGRPGEIVDVELASAVPLRVEVIEPPRAGQVIPNIHGFAWIPHEGVARDQLRLSIMDGACRYEAQAELVVP